MNRNKERSRHSEALKPENLDPERFFITLASKILEEGQELQISDLCRCANKCSVSSSKICDRFGVGQPSSFELQKWFQKQTYFQYFDITGKVDNKYDSYKLKIKLSEFQEIVKEKPIQIRSIKNIQEDIERIKAELSEEESKNEIPNNDNMEKENNKTFVPDNESIRRSILLMDWIKLKKEGDCFPSIRKLLVEVLDLPRQRCIGGVYHINVYEETKMTLNTIFGEGTFDCGIRRGQGCINKFYFKEDLDTLRELLVSRLGEDKPYIIPEILLDKKEESKEENDEVIDNKGEEENNKVNTEVVLCVIKDLIFKGQEITIPETKMRQELFEKGIDLSGIQFKDVLDDSFKRTLTLGEKGRSIDAWTYVLPHEEKKEETVVITEMRKDLELLVLSNGKSLSLESIGAELVDGAEVEVSNEKIFYTYKINVAFGNKKKALEVLRLLWLRKTNPDIVFLKSKQELLDLTREAEKMLLGED